MRAKAREQRLGLYLPCVFRCVHTELDAVERPEMDQNHRPCVPRRSVQIALAAPAEPQVASALGVRVLGAHEVPVLGFRGVFDVLGVQRAHPGTLSSLGTFDKLGVPSVRCVLLGTWGALRALGAWGALGCVNNLDVALDVAQYKWLV